MVRARPCMVNISCIWCQKKGETEFCNNINFFAKILSFEPEARGGGGTQYGGARLKPPNPYPSLRVILAEKGTHY